MKLLTASIVAALVLSATAWAQTGSPLPNDPGATVLGTFTVNTNILNISGGTNPNGTPRAKAKPATGDVIAEIIWMRTSDGKINYMINTGSIRLPENANELTTTVIYNSLADAAVVKGTNLEITGCATSSSSIVTTVWANSCVTRTGSGVDTRFAVANSNLVSARNYNVLCDAGGSLVTMLNISDPGCSSGSGIQ